MTLKESVRQIGRFIGVLPQQQPAYDPYAQGYPAEEDPYYNDGYDNVQYANVPPANDPYAAPPRAGGGQQRTYPQDEGYYPPRAQPQQRYPAEDMQQQPTPLFGNNQRSKRPPDNIVPLHRPEEGAIAKSRHSEIIVCVRDMEDCQEIINALLEGKSVFINMEPIDDGKAQRVIDMLGGASFALRGTMAKISHKVYLLAPNNVDVVNSQPTSAPAFRSEFSALRR